LKNIYKIVFLLLVFVSLVNAQQSDKTQFGGLTDIFEHPVGARAMAMGGAYVSVVDDPFALFWNPAALDTIPSIGLSLYHTNLLLDDIYYQYAAFAMPTLNIGTFSIGLVRLDAGTINTRDVDGSFLGAKQYQRSLYMLGYGKRLGNWLSVGATVKLEDSRFPGYADGSLLGASALRESAAGMDVGFMLTPQSNSAFFQHWTIAANAVNLLQRSIKLDTKVERSARTFRVGISKDFYIADQRDRFTLAYETDWVDIIDVPLFHHAGAEYAFNDMIMLRGGWNKRGDALEGYGFTWGVGAKYAGVQVDYSYWLVGQEAMYEGSHRISVTLNVGKSRAVKRQELQAEMLQQYLDRADREFQEQRENDIAEGRADAQRFYTNQEYDRAYRAIINVLSYADNENDPNFEQDRELVELIKNAQEADLAESLREEMENDRLQSEREQRLAIMQNYYNRANAYYVDGEYKEAIAVCDRALEEDPDNETIINLKNNCIQDLNSAITDLQRRARNLENDGQFYQALNLYTQARNLATGFDPSQAGQIEARIRSLNNNLSYGEMVREARTAELEENWAKAAELYSNALQIQSNPTLREKWRQADIRARAVIMEMTPDVKQLYIKGFNATQQRRYEEGIQYLEEALEIQPLNKKILSTLDQVRKLAQDTNTSVNE